MILGYCFGKLFTPAVEAAKRKRYCGRQVPGCWLSFILLRLINHYGDPIPWSEQPRGSIYTFLSFLNINKYPPSLDFLSVTIGAGMILLSWLEGIGNRLSNFFRVYGRVPMFYYILHFYILHTLVVIVFFLEGYSTNQIVTPQNPFLFRPSDFGFGLLGVYAIWIFVFLVLYPLCKKYDRYKSTHQKWWLSYL